MNPTFIVIGIASYHRRKSECVPTMATRKGDIQQWLSSKNRPWTLAMNRKDFLCVTATVEVKYRGNAMAEDTGHTVLRLSPYHCQLNPI